MSVAAPADPAAALEQAAVGDHRRAGHRGAECPPAARCRAAPAEAAAPGPGRPAGSSRRSSPRGWWEPAGFRSGRTPGSRALPARRRPAAEPRSLRSIERIVFKPPSQGKSASPATPNRNTGRSGIGRSATANFASSRGARPDHHHPGQNERPGPAALGTRSFRPALDCPLLPSDPSSTEGPDVSIPGRLSRDRNQKQVRGPLPAP